MKCRNKGRYKEGEREYHSRYYKKHKLRIKSRQQEYRQKHKGETRIRNKRNEFRVRYGIALPQYHELLAQQNDKCKLCKNFETMRRGPNRTLQNLSIDHCHKTGRIRGLLCYRCNIALGFLNDDPQLLRAAADYIEAHE